MLAHVKTGIHPPWQTPRSPAGRQLRRNDNEWPGDTGRPPAVAISAADLNRARWAGMMAIAAVSLVQSCTAPETRDRDLISERDAA